MKRITTIICCALLMVAGISLAIYNKGTVNHQTVMAAQPLQWNVKPGTLPLDIQFDLDKRLTREVPKTKDTVIIRDSVRIIEKIQWKTRYKTIAERTAAREVGEHLAAVNPDSMLREPTINSTLEREEKSSEVVDTSKVSSIQLTVNGEIVYSKNENHSTGEGQ
jgi:hypothetical protein